MKNIFDTHAHYDDEAFDGDRDELLGRILGESVSLIINCGCDFSSSLSAIALSEKYDGIYAAVGLHPENTVDAKPDELEKIEALYSKKRVVAVGEIGLDYYWDVPRDLQLEAFERQLELAVKLDLPVIVHDREAHKDTLDLLKKYRPKGVMHCFSGSVETAREVLDLGMYVGLGGAVTFKKAVKPVAVAGFVPAERLLLETDCPYMAPVPFRGKRCDSSMIAFVAEKIAAVKGMEAQELVDICNENGRRLFNI